MSSFKAISLSPSVTAIDATVNNTFTWQVQGGLQVKFNIYIFNNSTDALAYDSGVIVSSNQSHVIPGGTLTNGTDYKWYISTNTIIDSSETFISSEYEFFTCSAVPIVSFSYPTFTDKYCTRVESFGNVDDWATINASIFEDTITYKDYYGDSTIRLYSDTASGSFYMTKTISLDLSVFDNGSSSSTSDYIRIVAMCENSSTQDLYVQFTCASGYYYHTFNSTTDWVYYLRKSNFSSSGSPSWSAITEIKVGFVSTDASRTNYYFQAIELYKTGTGTDTVLGYQDNKFYLNYSQAQSVGIKKYKFILYDENQVEISDTGWLYDLLLNYEFTGLVNNVSYYIEGIIVSQYDQEGSTGLKPFSVYYRNTIILPDIESIISNTNGTITIDWSNINFSTATVANPSYTAGMFNQGLYLSDYTKTCTFSQTLPTTYTITYWLKLEAEHNGDFMQIGSNVTVGYDQSLYKFYYNDSGTYTYSDIATLFSFSDFGSDTWESIDTYTWLGSGIDINGFINEFLFIGITSKNFIVKKSSELISEVVI